MAVVALKPKNTRNTRQNLVDTALELIWRSSYNAVSVDEICRKSNVQKGSFYHYFPSKAHLALACMQSCFEEAKAAYDDMFSPVRPPLERFDMMIAHVIEQQKDISAELGHVCGCPFSMLGSELAAQDAEIGAVIISMIDRKMLYYESALRDMVHGGLIAPDVDVKLKAREIMAFISGMLIMARVQNDLSSIEKNLKRAVYDLIGITLVKE